MRHTREPEFQVDLPMAFNPKLVQVCWRRSRGGNDDVFGPRERVERPHELPLTEGFTSARAEVVVNRRRPLGISSLDFGDVFVRPFPATRAQCATEGLQATSC